MYKTAYLYHTGRHNILFIMMDCPVLLPRQVLLIFTQTNVIQRPPEKPVQPVLLLVIRWVRATEASQEFWRHLNDTRVTAAVLAHASTTQHRILGAIFVASRMSNVMCHYSYYKVCVVMSDSFLTCL